MPVLLMCSWREGADGNLCWVTAVDRMVQVSSIGQPIQIDPMICNTVMKEGRILPG